MNDTEKRLRENADNCIKNYQAWSGNQKDGKALEALHETIHELRKAVSRLEIEIAINERSEIASRPIPTPVHRSTRPQKEQDSHGNEADDGVGNTSGSGSGGGPAHSDNRNRFRGPGGRGGRIGGHGGGQNRPQQGGGDQD